MLLVPRASSSLGSEHALINDNVRNTLVPTNSLPDQKQIELRSARLFAHKVSIHLEPIQRHLFTEVVQTDNDLQLLLPGCTVGVQHSIEMGEATDQVEVESAVNAMTHEHLRCAGEASRQLAYCDARC